MTVTPPPTIGVNELMLEVFDLAASERFYTEVIGLEAIDRWSFGDGVAVVWLLAGDTRIGLAKPSLGLARARPGVHVHYAMRVADADYDDVVAGLRERGAVVEEVAFHGADGSVRGRSAYVDDPDHHVLEFWTRDAATVESLRPVAMTEGVYGLARPVARVGS